MFEKKRHEFQCCLCSGRRWRITACFLESVRCSRRSDAAKRLTSTVAYVRQRFARERQFSALFPIAIFTLTASHSARNQGGIDAPAKFLHDSLSDSRPCGEFSTGQHCVFSVNSKPALHSRHFVAMAGCVPYNFRFRFRSRPGHRKRFICARQRSLHISYSVDGKT